MFLCVCMSLYTPSRYEIKLRGDDWGKWTQHRMLGPHVGDTPEGWEFAFGGSINCQEAAVTFDPVSRKAYVYGGWHLDMYDTSYVMRICTQTDRHTRAHTHTRTDTHTHTHTCTHTHTHMHTCTHTHTHAHTHTHTRARVRASYTRPRAQAHVCMHMN
jgi:hypothetical protein